MLAVALALGALPAAHAADAFAYVSNEKAGVEVIDLNSLAVVKTMPSGGQGPRGIALTADGKYVLTANKLSGDLVAIDRVSGAVAHKVKVGLNPEFVRVNGKVAFVTYEPGASKEGGPKGGDKGGEKAGGDKDGAKGGKDDDDDAEKAEIALVDLSSWKVIRKIVSGHETEGVEFSKNGRDILVTNEGDDTVSVYDRTNGKEVKSIHTAANGKRPRGIKLSPDGSAYVVTLEYSDKFLVIDDRLNIVKDVPTKAGPYGVAFSPDGAKVLIAAAKDGVIQVFDAKSYELKGEIPVGKRCWHFSFTPDGSKILAACGRSDAVYVVDATNYSSVKVLDGAQAPWGVVTYPRASGTLEAAN